MSAAAMYAIVYIQLRCACGTCTTYSNLGWRSHLAKSALWLMSKWPLHIISA